MRITLFPAKYPPHFRLYTFSSYTRRLRFRSYIGLGGKTERGKWGAVLHRLVSFNEFTTPKLLFTRKFLPVWHLLYKMHTCSTMVAQVWPPPLTLGCTALHCAPEVLLSDTCTPTPDSFENRNLHTDKNHGPDSTSFWPCILFDNLVSI